VLLTSLSIFGVLALSRKPLSRWNALPLLAGIWYPICFLGVSIARITNGSWPNVVFQSTDLIIMLVPCIGVMAVGYILKSDALEETAALA